MIHKNSCGKKALLHCIFLQTIIIRLVIQS